MDIQLHYLSMGPLAEDKCHVEFTLNAWHIVQVDGFPRGLLQGRHVDHRSAYGVLLRLAWTYLLFKIEEDKTK